MDFVFHSSMAIGQTMGSITFVRCLLQSSHKSLVVVAESPDLGIRVHFGELQFTWVTTRATL